MQNVCHDDCVCCPKIFYFYVLFLNSVIVTLFIVSSVLWPFLVVHSSCVFLLGLCTFNPFLLYHLSMFFSLFMFSVLVILSGCVCPDHIFFALYDYDCSLNTKFIFCFELKSKNLSLHMTVVFQSFRWLIKSNI